MSWKEAMLVRQGKLEAFGVIDKLADDLDAPIWPTQLKNKLRELIAAEVDQAPAPNSGSTTSKAAAKNMRVLVGSLRYRALEAYKDGPLTDEECRIRLGREDGVWPRCSELRLLKLIEWTGETRLIVRSNQQGALSAITEAGRLVLTATTEKPQ